MEMFTDAWLVSCYLLNLHLVWPAGAKFLRKWGGVWWQMQWNKASWVQRRHTLDPPLGRDAHRPLHAASSTQCAVTRANLSTVWHGAQWDRRRSSSGSSTVAVILCSLLLFSEVAPSAEAESFLCLFVFLSRLPSNIVSPCCMCMRKTEERF